VKKRDWIGKTYSSNDASKACQKWIDDHPEAKTQKEIAAGLLETFKQLGPKAGQISRHLTGDAFDIQPVKDEEKADAIKKAVVEVQDIYTRNYFPNMKVSWNTYPNHIGHFYSPGCFRCHDGKHKSPEGKIISKDCNLCHSVLGQKQENIPPGTEVKSFVHPVDIGDEIYKTNCSDCHFAGGQDVPGGGGLPEEKKAGEKKAEEKKH